MAFINRIEVDEDTGRCLVTTDSPSGTEPYMNGIRYTDDDPPLMFVQDVAVATATYQEGIARDDDGVMYVRIDDAPTGSQAVFLNGMLADITGRLSMTTVNPIDTYMHGWPLDEDGSVCIIGTTPPPPTFQTFDTLIIDAANSEQFVIIDNLYFGDATNGGGFTQVQAVFLADNPGLNLQTFEGWTTDAGILPKTSFPGGFTCTDPSFGGDPDPAVAGKDVLGTPTAIYLSQNLGGQLVFTFSPVISAVGCNLAATNAGASSLTFTIKDGATTITSESAVTSPYSAMAAFAGYSSNPVVVADRRITADSDVRVTADGDTRIWR